MSLEDALQKAIQRPEPKKRTRPQKQPEKPKTPNRPKPKRTAPKRGRGGHIKAETKYTKRVTLDLTPEQDKWLAMFAVEHETKKAHVLRQLVDILKTDKNLTEQVLDNLDDLNE